MMAIFVWWCALPSVARRLIGAVLILGTSVGLIGLAVHRYGNSREAVGYHRAADSVSAIAIKRIAATETVYVKSAVRSDSLVQSVSHGHPAQHLVIQPVTVPVTTRDSAVRVIVEAFHDTVENVPVRAAQYWKQADSTAGLALQSASQWHAAYLASDSVAALYAQRLRNATALPASSHTRRDLVFTALGAVAGFVIARHIR